MLELSPRIEKLRFEKEALEKTEDRITLETKILDNRLKELSDFEKDVNDWLKASERYKELKEYLREISQEVDIVRNELRKQREELNIVTLERDKLEKHIENLQKNQSELLSLLNGIERHICSHAQYLKLSWFHNQLHC